MTEERVREIIAEEILKMVLSVRVSSDGYGGTFYISASLRYDGVIISESEDSFKP